MQRILAQFFSYLFHPLLFPTLGAIYLIEMCPYRFGHLDFKLQSLTVIIIFIIGFIFPVITLFILKQVELIDSYKLDTKKERIIPYIAVSTFYLWVFMMLRPGKESMIGADQLLANMMFGASAAIFAAFIVNIYFKVSIHAIATGSFIGLVLFSAQFVHFNITVFLFIAIAVAGVVGVSRLYLRAHKPTELYSGYFIGFASQFAGFVVYPMLKFL